MDVAAYLDRLGLDPPATADVAALRTLQERHLAVVPFENLSIHLGEPIVLETEALFGKIVLRRRGGFCYELNGLFAALLRELGFDAGLRSAKVFRPDGTLGPPFDHAVVHVELDEPWLADVGFGRFSRFPLRLAATEAQADPEGEFLVLDAPHGDIDVLLDGAPQYRIERRPRALDEFVPTAFWQSTSPDSHFTRGPTCSLPAKHGRVTLAGDKLIVTTHGVREETRLSGDQEILDVYRKEFGIALDRVP
ncbi:arylamine N-acetyltransferase [Amycolatopsis roodepoortensis]|uniref:arylamine N-acetyltransferase family protein n=1 Tax=Amycolatopsis roodepoortensis TaxID=700274 RepID=UPI000F885615|nr:arylamine N-acetyltransferase [Amycolatopsis roodepoortensis]RSN25354.1 acetyltransferase [Streptomyces sp. WAC 05977]UUV28849.1 arylamine N-acetyltransferase [Amycolatopsis roodepoortensis]